MLDVNTRMSHGHVWPRSCLRVGLGRGLLRQFLTRALDTCNQVCVRKWASDSKYDIINIKLIISFRIILLTHIICPPLPGNLFRFRGNYDGLFETRGFSSFIEYSYVAICGATYTFTVTHISLSVFCILAFCIS